jgi:hypothetical protein
VLSHQVTFIDHGHSQFPLYGLTTPLAFRNQFYGPKSTAKLVLALTSYRKLFCCLWLFLFLFEMSMNVKFCYFYSNITNVVDRHCRQQCTAQPISIIRQQFRR